MLRKIVIYFGAIAALGCASAFGEPGADDDGGRRSFPRGAKALEQRSAPVYYVSYDLYEGACTEDHCGDLADLFLKNVKKSVNPCDDFYSYSCAAKERKVHSITKEMQEILEEHPGDKEEMKSLTLEKRFYRSCMEQQESDKKTKQELTRLLELSNGLSLFRSEGKFGINDWQSIDAFYASLGFEHAFFNAHVTRDPEAADVNLIALMPPSPLYFYSLHGLLKSKDFADIAAHLIGDHDDNGKPYVTDYDDVYRFNLLLHEILPPLAMVEENITTLVKNKMSIEKWQQIYDGKAEAASSESRHESRHEPNHIHWQKILSILLKTANVHIGGTDQIVIKNVEYFRKLSHLLRRTSPITIEKYIHFKFISQISKYLSPKLARYFENTPDRPTFCIRQSDNKLIGASYEYIKRYISHKQKIYAEEVAENIRKSLVNLLSNSNWMDKETKAYAMGKLEKLDIMVGYPYWQTNRTFVNHYYGHLHLHSNYFENVILYKRKSLIHELRGLKHPLTFDPYTMSKKFVPLIYHFEVNTHLNRIIYPTEYLNEKKYKFFSPKLPRAINYGSFGTMLGSVLYDYVSLTDNLKYNEFYIRSNGGLSKSTIDAYKVKEKCLSSQLSHYKKSASTFSHSLASLLDRDTIQVDKIYEKMTGLRAAFEAFKKVESKSDESLPGFESLSNEQLFFLSYAERICEIGDIYDKYDTYETALKVNGVVSNLEAFSSVFRCPANSKMNRETKCELF